MTISEIVYSPFLWHIELDAYLDRKIVTKILVYKT